MARKVLGGVGLAAACAVLLILTGWAALMLHYSNLPWGWLRNAAAAASGSGGEAELVPSKNMGTVWLMDG